MFQTMMGADPRGVGRLPVQPRGRGHPGGERSPRRVAAKGSAAPRPARRCSYSAPRTTGGVEVRNQRGQLEQAATAKARRLAAAQQATQFGGELPEIEQQPTRGQQGPQRGGPQRPAPQRPGAPAPRGAFGQQQSDSRPAEPPAAPRRRARPVATRGPAPEGQLRSLSEAAAVSQRGNSWCAGGRVCAAESQLRASARAQLGPARAVARVAATGRRGRSRASAGPCPRAGWRPRGCG